MLLLYENNHLYCEKRPDKSGKMRKSKPCGDITPPWCFRTSSMCRREFLSACLGLVIGKDGLHCILIEPKIELSIRTLTAPQWPGYKHRNPVSHWRTGPKGCGVKNVYNCSLPVIFSSNNQPITAKLTKINLWKNTSWVLNCLSFCSVSF